MICPHCKASLRRKQRPNRTCSNCKRPFALDPKSNPFLANDLMVAKAADRLSDGGKLRYSGVQLWYAVSRKALRAKSSGVGCGFAAAIVALGAAGFCAVDAVIDRNYLLLAAMVVVWLAVLAIAVIAVANRRARIPTVEMPVKWSEFPTKVLAAWQQVYQADPPGLAKAAEVEGVGDPVLAVFCPDRSVLFCLQANGIPQRLRVALAHKTSQLPPGVPVLVLHDASPPGCALVGRTRKMLPGTRVMDGGLRPRAVMKARGAIHLRTPPREFEMAALATAGLERHELEWLARGWWSPIGAVRPAALIRRVEEAARRVDPAHKAAEEVGFLTWPAG